MALTEFGQWLEEDWKVRAQQPSPVHGAWYAGAGFTVRHTYRPSVREDTFSARANLDEQTGQVNVLVFASEFDQCANFEVPWEAWLETVKEVGAQRDRLVATLERFGGRFRPVVDTEAT